MPPLQDLTVFDLSRVLAGPYCTQLFADLGATVWKLEPLTGDDTRGWGPPFVGGESAYYLSVNRGKKSLALNLKDPRGQQIVKDLAKRADILVENFKVGDLARYGLDYASLAEINPELIYCSITGFGQNGPRAREPGYDAALQGLSGLMSITGEADGPPAKVGVAVVDVLTGLHAAVSILAALHERQRTGEGQHLDIALFDVALASLVNQVQSTLITGTSPGRMGSAHPQIVPYQAFEARDGYFMVAVGNDAQYRRLCEAVDLPEFWEDERLQTNAGRVAHREIVVGKLAERFRQETRGVWLERLKNAGVPASPVNTVLDALNDPQVAARGLRLGLEHPTIGHFETLGSPLPGAVSTPDPPPQLGADGDALLSEVLGYSDRELDDLKSAGVILEQAEREPE